MKLMLNLRTFSELALLLLLNSFIIYKKAKVSKKDFQNKKRGQHPIVERTVLPKQT